MAETNLEERKTTLVDKLKSKASTLQQGTLGEICIILVDTSSSMSESINRVGGRSKIEAVRLAIPNLQAVGGRVMYGLVGFGSFASILQNITTQFGLIMSQGEMLNPEGMTNMTDGIRKGLEIVGGKFAEKKRVVMLSDGCANVEKEEIDYYLGLCCKGGVIIDTIAFGGEAADKRRLKDIAHRTGGVFYEAGDEQQLRDAYAKLNYNVRYLEHHRI